MTEIEATQAVLKSLTHILTRFSTKPKVAWLRGETENDTGITVKVQEIAL